MFVLGIHIESYGIYTVAIHSKESNLELLEKRLFPLNLDGDLKDRNMDISITLKSILNTYPSDKYSYAISMAQNSMSIHDFQFPFTEKFKINQALPFEIESSLPLFANKDIVFSFKQSYIKKRICHILACISSKSNMEELVKPLSIIPQNYIFTSLTSSISNLFENWKEGPLVIDGKSEVQADQIVLYLGYKNSNLLVLHEKSTIHSLYVDWGIESIVKNIAARYKRNLSQALTYFYENAFISKDTPEIRSLAPLSNMIKQSFDELVLQLKLIRIHLNGKGYNSSIKKISLLGPGSHIQNITYHLFNELKIETEKLQTQYPIQDQRFFVAFGTAVEHLKTEKNPPMNMVKYLRKPSDQKWRIQSKRLVLQVASLLIVIYAYTSFRSESTQSLNKKVSQVFTSLSRKVAGFKLSESSVENVQKFIKNKNTNKAQNKTITSLQDTSFALSTLERISFSLNKKSEWNLKVTEIQVDNKSVVIKGYISKDHLEDLKNDIKSIAKNGKVKLSTPKMREELDKDKAGFHMDFKIKT